MMEIISTIIGINSELTSNLPAVFCVFLRVGGAMAFLPVLGEHVVPVRIRVIATICLTCLIVNYISTVMQDNISALYLFFNIVIGLAIGLSFRVIIFSIEICGHIISNVISMAQIFPNGAEVSPVISTLMKYLATLILINVGIVERYLSALSLEEGNSNVVVVSNQFATLLTAMSKCLSVALILSAPFIIFSILYNISLGVMNRIMPGLMVHLIFAPAMALCGLMMLSFVITYSLLQWLQLTL